MVNVQARCDEKGFLAVAAFGLRMVHDDSPARGLSAALAIVRDLQVHLLCVEFCILRNCSNITPNPRAHTGLHLVTCLLHTSGHTNALTTS
jgi:hypothetical protein